MKIQLFGHSFVHRLKRFIADSPEHRFDLGLRQQVMIQYSGISGATVLRLADNLEVVQDFSPDIVFLMVGTNDLFYPHTSPDSLSKEIFRLVEALITSGVRYVIVSQILHRMDSRFTRFPVDITWFNARVDTTNNLLKDQLSHRYPNKARFWRLKGFWGTSAKQSAIKRDGVHMSDRGNLKLIRNIQAALVTTLNKVFQ